MRAAERERGQVLLLLVAILGLGAASLFLGTVGKPRLEAAREQRTLQALRDAREALVGFATTHGRLPRPAISVTNGFERTTPCASEAACTGFLPWATLGVRRTDAWGKLIRYSVTPVFTESPVQRTSAFGTKTVLTRGGGGAIAYIAGNPNCSLASPCMAAVLHSAGRDNFGVSDTGAILANGAAGNVDEAANIAAVQNFMRRPATDDPRMPGGVFDDFVDYIDPQVLYVQMTRANVLP
ncbi:hypothetical protein [Pseudoduganella sp. GCM10020061]|uniref:hypothetical protein n=1 Tax=Pseudoduganella sp. GCM10020061 TaxID=3317345 RepID=UPI003640E2B0